MIMTPRHASVISTMRQETVGARCGDHDLLILYASSTLVNIYNINLIHDLAFIVTSHAVYVRIEKSIGSPQGHLLILVMLCSHRDK